MKAGFEPEPLLHKKHESVPSFMASKIVQVVLSHQLKADAPRFILVA